MGSLRLPEMSRNIEGAALLGRLPLNFETSVTMPTSVPTGVVPLDRSIDPIPPPPRPLRRQIAPIIRGDETEFVALPSRAKLTTGRVRTVAEELQVGTRTVWQWAVGLVKDRLSR